MESGLPLVCYKGSLHFALENPSQVKARPAGTPICLDLPERLPRWESRCVRDPGKPLLQCVKASIMPVAEGGAASLCRTKMLQLLHELGQREGTKQKVRTGKWGSVCPSISAPVVSPCREHALPAKALTILESVLITWAQQNGEGKRTMLSLCLMVGCLEPKTS